MRRNVDWILFILKINTKPVKGGETVSVDNDMDDNDNFNFFKINK